MKTLCSYVFAWCVCIFTYAQDTCYVEVNGNDFAWSYDSDDYNDGETVGETIIQPGTSYGFTFDIYSLDNSFNLEINGVKIATEEIEFQSSGTPGINIMFVDNDQYENNTPNIYSMEGNANTPIIRVSISPTGQISMFGSKESYGPLFPLKPRTGMSNTFTFNNINWNPNSNNTIEVTQLVKGPTDIEGYGYGKSIFTNPQINAGNDSEICLGEEVTLSADNPDNATISWNNNVQDGVAFTPGVGNNTYILTAVNETGEVYTENGVNTCSSTDTVEITVHNLPNIEAGSDQEVCEGGSVTLSGDGAGTGGTYSWDNNVSDGTPFVPINTTTYTVTGTDANTCENTDLVTVTINENPTYSANTIMATCGLSNGEIVCSAIGGESPYNYSIDNGTTFQNENTFSDLPNGTYEIVIEDNNGCSTTGSETINIADGPSINNINIIEPSCFGECDGSINIEASGGSAPYSYIWTNEIGDTLNASANVISDLCDGDYNIEVLDTNNCEAIESITITEPQELDASFTGLNNEYCTSDALVSLTPTQTGGTFSGPGISGATFDPYEAGIGSYTITYILGNANCGDTATMNVDVGGPIASFNALPSTATVENPSVEFTNESQNANDYIWDFGDNSSLSNDENTSHNFPGNGSGFYIVTLTASDENNCSDTYSDTIFITIPEINYEIPNIFTPNGDGANDFFKIIHYEGVKSLEIQILNRWGNLVFESDKINFNWNGKSNNEGAECSDGTYFYKIIFKDLDKNEKLEHGFLQLVRSK